MKRIFMAAAVIATVLFTGCNSGGGDPKTVLMAFFEAMSKKDIAAAKKLATKDSEKMFSFMETAMKMGGKDNKNEMNFEKDKVVFGETKIEGDKATIEVKDKEKGEGLNFVLRKESGDWKVAFDKGWFAQMAAEKMQEHGGMQNVMDSLNSGLDQLKNINSDSLAGKIKEGVDKLKEIQEKNPEAMKKLEEAAKKIQEEAKKN